MALLGIGIGRLGEIGDSDRDGRACIGGGGGIDQPHSANLNATNYLRVVGAIHSRENGRTEGSGKARTVRVQEEVWRLDHHIAGR